MREAAEPGRSRMPKAATSVEVHPPGSPTKDTAYGSFPGGQAGLGGTAPSLSSHEREEVNTLRAGIDLSDPLSMRLYGAAEERELSQLSEQMVQAIQARSLAASAEALNQVGKRVKELGVYQVTEVGHARGASAAAVREALRGLESRHESLWAPIEELFQRLRQGRRESLESIAQVEELQRRFLEQIKRLTIYLVAGEEFMRESNSWTLPGLQAEAGSWGDPWSGRSLEDFRHANDAFARRLHELKRTHMLAGQTAQQVRLLQRSDEDLRQELQDSAAATIPFWTTQVAAALNRCRAEIAGGQSGTLDLQSLREADESLLTALDRAKLLLEQADAARRQGVAELRRLQTDLERRRAG